MKFELRDRVAGLLRQKRPVLQNWNLDDLD